MFGISFPKREYDFGQRCVDLFHKIDALLSIRKGSRLDIAPGDLPSHELIEEGRSALERLCEFHEFSEIARPLSQAFDSFYYALIVPDLKLRQAALEEAGMILRSRGPLRELSESPERRIAERESMLPGESVVPHLSRAAYLLGAALLLAETPVSTGPGRHIGIQLGEAIASLIEAERDSHYLRDDR